MTPHCRAASIHIINSTRLWNCTGGINFSIHLKDIPSIVNFIVVESTVTPGSSIGLQLGQTPRIKVISQKTIVLIYSDACI